MKLFYTILTLLCLATPLYAQDVTFTGAAQEKPQITDVDITGTWADGDTAFIERNNKRVTVTLDSTAAAGAPASLLIQAMAATGPGEDTDTGGDGFTGTWDHGGQEYGEFQEVITTLGTDSNDLILTTASIQVDDIATNGVPFTVTVGETSSAGVMGAPSNSQEAGGAHHWDDDDNWLDPNGDVGVPLEGEDPILADSSKSIYFGLDNLNGDLNITKLQSYTGNVGLKPVNTWSSTPFTEDRPTKLQHVKASVNAPNIYIGEIGSPLPALGWFYLRMSAATDSNIFIYDAPKVHSFNGFSVQLHGGGGCEIIITRGSLSLGEDPTEAVLLFKGMHIGYQTTQATDVNIRAGDKVQSAGGTVVQQGGQVDWNISGVGSNITSWDLQSGTMHSHEGVTITTFKVHDGGILYHHAGVGTLNNITVLSGGTLDARRATIPSIANTIFVHKGAIIYDPSDMLKPSGDWDFIETYPGDPDSTIVLPINQTWAPTPL